MNDALFGSAGMTPEERAAAQSRAWIGFCALTMYGNCMRFHAAAVWERLP
ncbi:MAG TPA: hypothetical protein VHE37_03780 [Nevskiaceae bacterium]|nr:hypothetical protein [Nevskiaceae bacterium]